MLGDILANPLEEGGIGCRSATQELAYISGDCYVSQTNDPVGNIEARLQKVLSERPKKRRISHTRPLPEQPHLVP